MELQDGEIALRPWRESDAPAVHAACQDPDILHWMPILPRPYTLEDARAFVTDELGLGPHQFAVTKNGLMVGSIGLRVGRFLIGEIGYWCAPAARGDGVIPRAGRLICRYAFEELHLERLQIAADPDNRASQRVAEKLGFQREGVLRSHLAHPDGRRRDSLMFSLLPGELAGS